MDSWESSILADHPNCPLVCIGSLRFPRRAGVAGEGRDSRGIRIGWNLLLLIKTAHIDFAQTKRYPVDRAVPFPFPFALARVRISIQLPTFVPVQARP